VSKRGCYASFDALQIAPRIALIPNFRPRQETQENAAKQMHSENFSTGKL
jgi:hypothetical protein